jgi:hypothetical protein
LRAGRAVLEHATPHGVREEIDINHAIHAVTVRTNGRDTGKHGRETREHECERSCVREREKQLKIRRRCECRTAHSSCRTEESHHEHTMG